MREDDVLIRIPREFEAEVKAFVQTLIRKKRAQTNRDVIRGGGRKEPTDR